MDGGSDVWRNLRSGLWSASAGLAAGAALAAAVGRGGLWLALGSAAVAAGVAVFAAGRIGRGPQASSQAGTDSALSLLPPLAREVLERLPDPLMLVDAGGRVVFANKAMRAVVGTDAQRKHVSAVLRTPDVLQAIAHNMETGEPAAIEFTFHVPVERNYQAYVTRTEHEPRLSALLLHDLTAIKRAEEARADFVANASHELRTPLSAVSGFIDTLRGHAKDDPKAREKFLEIMSVEAGRMRRLIDDLLSLTRIEQNEHVPPSGRVDLAGVVRDAAAALGPLAEADKVAIEIAESSPLPEIAGQRDDLIQIFQNLIHNAIKYGRPGGHVWLAMEMSEATPPLPGRRGGGAMVSVSVRDDGEGIPREAIPRLTERFYRVDVKRSRERGGTGLGLAIVKHIVNRHQGRIAIDSQIGSGTTFTISLPVAPPP
jgi:two-component system, OmpR family, phosphate regulon sensor histidine kinase PhoR